MSIIRSLGRESDVCACAHWSGRLLLAALISLTIAPLTLSAQTPARDSIRADSSARADSLRQVQRLNPVVTTAARDARELRRLPVSMSVVDSATLAKTSTISLSEALRTVPGVRADGLFGGDDVKLSIRGSGVRSGFGVRGIGVLLDGVPITEPDGQTRLDLLELGSARRIEVVRGPASALYGGAGSGGVINIITKTGREAPGLTLRMLGGGMGVDSALSRKIDGAWGGARGPVDAYLQASWTDLDGYRSHAWNDMRRANARVNWQAAADTRVGFDASWSTLDMRIPGALTRPEWVTAPTTAEPNNVLNDFARRDERWRAGARLTHAIAGGASGTIDGFAFLSGRTLDHPIFRYIDQNQHRVQLGAKHAIEFDAAAVRTRLTTGVDYDRAYGASWQYANVGGSRVLDRVCVSDAARGISSIPCVDQRTAFPTIGAYGQTESSIGRLTATLGARYDRVTYDIDDRIIAANSIEQQFGQLSPKLALSWQVARGVSTYLSIARGFDVPTSGELTASPDTLRGLNTDLEPARLVNYELGAKALVGDRMLVDVALFRTDVDGEFISRSVIIPGVTFPRTIYENVGESRRLGFESSATAYLAPSFDATASYTLAAYTLRRFAGTEIGPDFLPVQRDYAGNQMPGVPRHRAAVELRWRPADAVSTTLWGEWQSRTYIDNANTPDGFVYVRQTRTGMPPLELAVPFGALPSYGLVHASASWRVRAVDLFASVQNLLDRDYVSNAAINAANGRFYYPGAGRTLMLGVTLSAFGGQ